jgi:tetratricopeptide (TPR) repeat protein
MSAAAHPDGTVEHAQVTPPLLRVHLLGGFRTSRDGGARTVERWSRPGARTLVKLLAIAPRHQLHREQIMAVCWPDAELAAALHSLRVALHTARHALEPELAPRVTSAYLIGDGAMLRLAPDRVWVDVDHAVSLAEQALATGSVPQLTAASAAFTGEPLPEDRYAAWAEPCRDRTADLCRRVRLALSAARPTDAHAEVDAARVRLAWATTLERAGRYEEAEHTLREALAAFERHADHDDRVLTTARLAEVLCRSATTAQAHAMLRLHLPGPRSSALVTGTHHMASAMVGFYAGQYEEALVAARTTQDTSSSVEGTDGLVLRARALALQAACLGLTGHFDQAIAPAEQALPPAEASGDVALLANVLSVLRENTRLAGHLDEALAYGRRALTLAERAARPTATAFERANLAELHLLRGEPHEAEQLARSAVELAEPFGEAALAFACVALARVRLRPDPEEAAALLDRAERCAVDSGHHQALSEVRGARGELTDFLEGSRTGGR